MNTPKPLMDLQPARSRFLEEARAGLMKTHKKLSPKFLYDQKGSELFEKICDLKEYYPTRTEMTILHTHLKEICSMLGDRCVLIEYGSGASKKTRLLLDHLESPDAYVPIDISKEILLDSAATLSRLYPSLEVLPICADYTQPISIPASLFPGSEKRVIFFPGSTLGNFEPAEAIGFLRVAAQLAQKKGRMLIGVDLVKDKAVLEAAYDDSLGVTAAFNLNLLKRMNRELGADFNTDYFYHRALFNENQSRMEMHLVSRKRQSVRLNSEEIRFESEESIHTESSYKFTSQGFKQLTSQAGLSIIQEWTDPNRWFGVYLLEVTELNSA